MEEGCENSVEDFEKKIKKVSEKNLKKKNNPKK